MKAPSRLSRLAVVWPFVAVILVLVAWFHEPVGELLVPGNWKDWITDEKIVGGILGGVVSGVLTIIAGITAILIHNRESQSEGLRSFLEWLSNFNSAFHKDADHAEVRIRLAKDRSGIRRELSMELLSDGEIKPEELPSGDRALASQASMELRRGKIDWKFMRLFTDYLYFFEEILAFGEVLAREGKASQTQAHTLVNHFGWFLRSLCMCWWDEEWTAEERDRAEGVFVIYLAVNRYRRLAEVALLLRIPGDPDQKPTPYDLELFERVMKVLKEQTSGEARASDYAELQAEWKAIIGPRGFIPSLGIRR